ncbi:MAG TPA: 3-methyladenine DNA glycosylase [Rhizobiales bacterium]|nr:3-methyladenine DNA glycosylase [Hyphomicrobiales bacterium]
MSKMAKKLKYWFDRDCAFKIATAIKPHFEALNIEEYADMVEKGIDGLELKDRVFVMAQALRVHMPRDYKKTSQILHKSLGPTLETEEGMFSKGYWLMPVARLVEEFGTDYFDISMDLCAEITKRNTSEYAVRPYIELDPEKALDFMKNWAGSENAHVRRLAVEGGRPRLPWAKRLPIFIEDPEPMLDLVEPLKTDPSRYVRKSVANLINDVSKDHPERIGELVKDWSTIDHPYTQWILKHGTRTLRK